MHEWKITEAVIEEVLTQARKHELNKIEKVVLSIGEDADFTASEIEFCFKVLVKDAILKDVNLEIKKRAERGGIIVESIEGEKGA